MNTELERAKTNQHDGGPIEKIFGIINSNADMQKARQVAQDADRAGAAKRQARKRQMQVSNRLHNIALVGFGFGVAPLLGVLLPTWLGVVTLFASWYILIKANKIERSVRNAENGRR